MNFPTGMLAIVLFGTVCLGISILLDKLNTTLLDVIIGLAIIAGAAYGTYEIASAIGEYILKEVL